MNNPPTHVVCISSSGDELSVMKGKVYRVLPPEPNDPPSMYRVVDEEGEDYLYDRAWFEPVDLSKRAAEALEAARVQHSLFTCSASAAKATA